MWMEQVLNQTRKLKMLDVSKEILALQEQYDEDMEYGRKGIEARDGEIERLRKKVKATYPEKPIFEVERQDGIYLFFECPVCEAQIYHAGEQKFGDGDGERESHCMCWDQYTIVEKCQ